MSPTIPTEESSIGYALDGTSPQIDFNHTFAEDIELMGRPVVALWVSVDGHDDADIFVRIEKLDARGRQVWHQLDDLGLPLARKWMPVANRLGLPAVGPAFYAGPNGKRGGASCRGRVCQCV